MGKCDNSNCRIKSEQQYFRKGFGAISVNKEVFGHKCVACSKELSADNVNNILFYGCKFSIEGRTDGKLVEKCDCTGAGNYITF